MKETVISKKLYYDIKMALKLCEVLSYLGHLYCWLITVNRERETEQQRERGWQRPAHNTTTIGLCWQITDKIPGYPQDVTARFTPALLDWMFHL